MHHLVIAAASSQELDGPVGDDLVAVHVKGDTRPGLEDVHGDLVSQPALQELVGGLNHGDGDLRIEISKLAVGEGCGLLEGGVCCNEGRMCTHAADGKVLEGAHGLYPIVGFDGDFPLSEGVFLDASGGHGFSPEAVRLGGGRGTTGTRDVGAVNGLPRHES